MHRTGITTRLSDRAAVRAGRSWRGARWYYQPAGETAENLALMRRIDEQYLQTPFYGSRKLAVRVGRQSQAGAAADAGDGHWRRSTRSGGRPGPAPDTRFTRIYCGMWRSRGPTRCGASDITYVPLRHGFMYLVAVMDWYSRYVLAWRLSNTLDGHVLFGGVGRGAGAWQAGDLQHRSRDRSSRPRRSPARLETAGVAISMDGRGRALDNVFIERLWRSVKYEEVYLKDYARRLGGRGVAGARTSASTATSACIRRWTIAHRRKCTGKGETADEKVGWQKFRASARVTGIVG